MSNPIIEQFLQSRWYVRTATQRLYRHILTRFDTWLDGRAITPQTINEHLACLKNQNLADDTIRNVCKTLKSYGQWLVEQRLLPNNPAERIKLPPIKRRVRQVYTDRDIARLLAATDYNVFMKQRHNKMSRIRWSDSGPYKRECLQAKALILLLCDSAMRAGEVCRLNCGDVRSKRLTIISKGGHEDAAFITDPTRKILRKLADTRPDDAPLFRNWDGGRCTPAALRGIVQRLAKRANVVLPDKPLHAFRHYAARRWVRAGASMLAVQRLMRHAQITTTQIYTDMDYDQLRSIHMRVSPVANLLQLADEELS